MRKILVVDDERIEREGVKYLLSMEEGEMDICEAANGKQALQVLKEQPIDLLLTDIKMPYMNGLELARNAKELNEDIQVIIFSGYNDFSFAQEALHYGVSDYVLKPVDPDRFHETFLKVEKKIVGLQEKKTQERKEKNYLQQYFLQNYLYIGKKEILELAKELIDIRNWNGWHCAILIECNETFFDTAEDALAEELEKELRRNFFYLNLNAKQSLLLFQDIYCDYQLVASHIYSWLRKTYTTMFYMSVSRKFDGFENLPDIMDQLEQQMEEKFYHPDKHVFSCEEDLQKSANKEVQDARLMQMISEDISRKDIEQLWKHFYCLKDKYQENAQYSAMYIKFVFSGVIQELFQENQFASEHRLEQEIEKLYKGVNILEILSITEENIKEYEEFLNRSMHEARDEIAAVKNYIYQHYYEDLNLEMLSEKVYLSSGYLSFIFKKETGMNLNRFIRVCRMEKAKELLTTTNMKVNQVAEKVGFSNFSYFCRSFREYYGCSPESYRKGNGEDE